MLKVSEVVFSCAQNHVGTFILLPNSKTDKILQKITKCYIVQAEYNVI